MILVVMVLMAVCSLGYAGKVQASGFQAKKASSNSVIVKWGKDKTASKYLIYRCAHKKARGYALKFKLVKTAGKNTVCWIDRGLTRNMYYDYKVCIVYKNGRKACSVKRTVFLKK